jgi:hypothetical protein
VTREPGRRHRAQRPQRTPRKHPIVESLTAIPEMRLAELRVQGADASRAQGGFVNPRMLHQCEQVLDRRGEEWAAQVLGRDISRRSIVVRHRPYLRAGEGHILVLSDAEEDRIAIAHLDPRTAT